LELAIRLKQKLNTEGKKYRVYFSEVKEQADKTFSSRGIHPAFILASSQASTRNGNLLIAVASYRQVSCIACVLLHGREICSESGGV